MRAHKHTRVAVAHKVEFRSAVLEAFKYAGRLPQPQHFGIGRVMSLFDALACII